MAGSNLTRVVPHTVIPGVIAPVNQNADYLKAFAGITKLGEIGDDYAYLTTLEKIHTPTTIGQQWRGGVDTAQFATNQLAYQYYTIQARFEYTDQQAAKLGKILPGIGIHDLFGRLSRQGIAQRDHYGALFGFDPAQTQGLVKQGTTASFPADSDGHSTLTAYNPDELMAFMAGQARTAMNNTYGMAKPVVFMSSVRVVNWIKSTMINLTQYQMPGAGVDSVGGAYSRVVGEWLGVGKIDFVADDLLKAAGTNSTDVMLFVAPGLSEQDKVDPRYSQYQLDDLPHNMMNTFKDEAGGLIESPNPIIDRVTSVNLSLQTTPGAVTRADAVRVIEVAYE
jgi:hypothetical protein